MYQQASTQYAIPGTAASVTLRSDADDPLEQARQKTLTAEQRRWEAFVLVWRKNFPNRRLDPEAWKEFVLKVYRPDVLYKLLEDYALQTAGRSDFDKVPSQTLIESRYWAAVKSPSAPRTACGCCKGRRQLFMLWNYSTDHASENPVDFRVSHWRDYNRNFSIVSMTCPVCDGRHHDHRELERIEERSLPYFVMPDSDDYPADEPILDERGSRIAVTGYDAILARLRMNDKQTEAAQ